MDQNTKKNNEGQKEGYSGLEAMKSIQNLKNLKAAPSPYLKNRVLRNMQPVTANTYGLFNWWRTAVAFGFCALIAIFIFKFFLSSSGALNNEFFALGKPYLVRVDIRPLVESSISYAEISLPDDKLQFASANFEDINKQKKLIVSWDSLLEKQYMPIVIKGLKEGSSKVVVQFFDSERNLVTSKEVSLYFKAGI